MKAKLRQLLRGILFTILLTASHPAFAFFDPTVGRFISRDPIGEDGGLNLYGFVANTPINAADDFGLWQIQRKGGARAKVIPDAGDTVDSLAQLIGLDDTDYHGWLQPVDHTQMPASASTQLAQCGAFTVPNTIYYEDGPLLSWIDHFGPIPQWQSEFASMASANTASGFNVIIRQPSSADTAKADLQDKNIYGWAFAGHGGGSGTLVFASGEQAVSLVPQRYTAYGIDFLYAYGCDTAAQNPVNDPHHILGYKISEWEKNIATRGMFTGIWGVVNGYQADTHKIESPGTNTQ